jgi:NAD(P)H-dependent flavin oxidoreductase YrpB (nitropropane dioxygenase family)
VCCTRPLCDLLGIDVPIVQAAIAPFTTPALAAAVASAGGLGSLGTVFKSRATIQADIEQTRELTNRSFVVNFTRPMLDEAAFAATLEECTNPCHSPGKLPGLSTGSCQRRLFFSSS